MKRTVMLCTLVGVGLIIAAWFLGFGIGGCTSSVNEDINSASTTTTITPTTTLPVVLNGISGTISWSWTGYNAADRWGTLQVTIFPDENFDPGRQKDVKLFSISGEASQVYNFDFVNNGTYYIVAVLFINRHPLPFDQLNNLDKLGQYSDGNLPIVFGGNTHAQPIGYSGTNVTGIDFSLNAIYMGGSVTPTTIPTGTTLPPITGTWKALGGAGFSAGTIDYPTTSVYNGVPYIAFSDGTNSNKATVMKYNSGSDSWAPVGKAGFSDGQADYPCLSIDPTNGDLYLAYADQGHGSRATVVKYNTNSASWETLGGAGFTAGQAEYVSLCIDNNGTPFLAFQDDANSKKVSVMKYDSGSKSWAYLGYPAFSSQSQTFYLSPRWLVAVNGTPYVAYWDEALTGKATCMKYNGADWVSVGTAGFTAGQAAGISLALYNGKPCIAFTDGDQSVVNKYRATVMNYDGSSWQVLGAPRFSAGEGHSTSLFVDNGIPYVAYSDYIYGHKAVLVKYNSGTWQNAGGSTFSAGSVSKVYLYVYNNIPYVTYIDEANGNKATVMQFQ